MYLSVVCYLSILISIIEIKTFYQVFKPFITKIGVNIDILHSIHFSAILNLLYALFHSKI